MIWLEYAARSFHLGWRGRIVVPWQQLWTCIQLADWEGGGVTVDGEAKGAADGLPLRDSLYLRPIDSFLFLVRGILY